MKIRRPANRKRAIASAPRKPMTIAQTTVPSVISAVFFMSGRNSGSCSTSLNECQLIPCGQNCGVAVR